MRASRSYPQSKPDALGNTVTQSYKEDGRIEANTLGTYNYANNAKKYQNTSVTLNPEAAGYYGNREGVFDDSMEDKKGWAISDPTIFSYDSTEKHSGNTSLKIANTTTSEKVIHSDIWTKISNTAPTQYTYSAWVKSDNPQAELFLFMKTETETNYYTYVDSKVTDIKNQWAKIEGTFTVPADVTKLNLRLDNNGLGNVWFDDVKIRKTANAALADKQITDVSYKDHQLNVKYNTFKSPVEISEAGVDKISFVYNDNNSRSVMFYGSLDDNKTLRPNRKYYSADGTMEIKQNILTGETEFVTYLGGDGYSAPVVYKKTFNTAGVAQEQMLYLHRDYQGSIQAITNDVGFVLEKRQFDAWGEILKVQDGAGNALAGLTILDRGYTGHEHLQSVGLINMNGRLYDAKLHRFLQPDNYVQDPSNTQNYNRYGYVLNNPLKYIDINGESFWKSLGNAFSDAFKAVVNVAVAVVTTVVAVAIISTAITVGTVVGIGQFVGSGFQNSSILTNQGRILGGMFQGNIGQIASRFTKELPQTLMGLGVSLGANALGRVRSVNYYGGATVVQHYSERWGGFTLGSYINGDSSIEADPNNRLFQHEYGHYLQSQEFGLAYMNRFALPSLFDTFGDGDHRQHFAEQDANSRAFTYFNEHVENYNGWNHGKYGNPINGYDWSKSYNDVANQLALSNNIKRPKWYRFEF